MDWQVNSGVDNGVGSTVKQSEWDQVDAIGMELMLRGNRGVEEAVGGTRVNEGVGWCSQKEIRGT